jgi:hypothetical protein
MRELLLAAVAAAALTSGYAVAQGMYSAPPLDLSRVDSKDLIKHYDEKVDTPIYTPEQKNAFSNSDLQRRLDALAKQEQQIRVERQAIADEAARRAKQ